MPPSPRSKDSRTLFVLMKGRLLGEVYQDRSGGLRLAYDEQYRAALDAEPLSLSMPLIARRHRNAAVSAWLENLLPNNPDVLARWRREFKVRDTSAFALLQHVGEDVAGAAQFVVPQRVDQASRTGEVVPVSTADIAERLRRLHEDPSAWDAPDGTGQFSLAGQQSKFALHFDGTTWSVPTGRTPTTHIVKPAIRRLVDQDINEHLTMRAAAAVGLIVPESRIETFDEQRAFVVARYDRVQIDEVWHRVHQEDFCQALGLSPVLKYEMHGGPGAIDIVTMIRRSVDADAAERDVFRFVDALIYNWLVVGTDAHAKNYSLLLDDSHVRLAPLYDLNSYLPYQARTKKPVLSMKIGTYKTRADLIGAAEWRAFARVGGVPEEHVFARIAEMSAHLPDCFSDLAKEPEIRGLGSDLPGRLADLVAARIERAL